MVQTFERLQRICHFVLKLRERNLVVRLILNLIAARVKSRNLLTFLGDHLDIVILVREIDVLRMLALQFSPIKLMAQFVHDGLRQCGFRQSLLNGFFCILLPVSIQNGLRLGPYMRLIINRMILRYCEIALITLEN